MTLELKKVNKPILILCIKYLDFFFTCFWILFGHIFLWNVVMTDKLKLLLWQTYC